MSSGTQRRIFWQPAAELALICAALSLLCLLGARVFAGVAASGTWWIVPIAMLTGVLAADFMSGAVHWFGDSFFQRDSPVIGPMLIGPFRDHHGDPEAITRHGLLELHGNSAIPVVAALLVATAVMPEFALERDGTGAGKPGALPAASVWLALYTWLFFFASTSLATNQLHVWAHREKVPRGIALLQRTGLILTPSGHQQHHSGSFRRSYCITTGWLNPWLDRIDFFPQLERRIRALPARFVKRTNSQ